MHYSIDRIEEGWAVCEGVNGAFVRVPAGQLPAGAREGSVLLLANGVWVLDREEEDARRKRVFALQEALFGDCDS